MMLQLTITAGDPEPLYWWALLSTLWAILHSGPLPQGEHYLELSMHCLKCKLPHPCRFGRYWWVLPLSEGPDVSPNPTTFCNEDAILYSGLQLLLLLVVLLVSFPKESYVQNLVSRFKDVQVLESAYTKLSIKQQRD